MAASKHTHTSANAITLVWGSLRLAPISTQSSCIELHELTCPILTYTHTRTRTERLDGPNVLLVYTGVC